MQDGYSALHIASLKGHESIVRILVDWGANVNNKQKVIELLNAHNIYNTSWYY